MHVIRSSETKEEERKSELDEAGLVSNIEHSCTVVQPRWHCDRVTMTHHVS